MDELTEQTRVRREKLLKLKAANLSLYPNDFRVDHTTAQVIERFGALDNEALRQAPAKVALAGRIMTLRSFGKASFFHLQDRKGRLQIYARQDRLGNEAYEQFRSFDLGDLVGVRGELFRTKTGELTVEAGELRLLAKCLRPLPEKWHGLADVETRYRQRYLDLMVNADVKRVFERRSQIVRAVRRFLEEKDFLEVETPMMQPLPGGAAAKPFVTHHNALNLDLYLRVAPELYLKRLLVGGMERVFELNRNFRNEGVSVRHNPEFTMVEFYQAYATYEDLMSLTEELFVTVARELGGGLTLSFDGHLIDLQPPWRRLPLAAAVVEYGGAHPEEVLTADGLRGFARRRGLAVEAHLSYGELLVEVFEKVAEEHLIQPTFVTQFPVEVSPLARRSEANPSFVDRFELYIGGRELANAFSELNDPLDQRERLRQQAEARRAGDESASPLDEDFLRALEFGMPPAAGEGIGIDRMVMLFTGCTSIRDVILFPLLRPET
ncbi:MAG TPA: lysine--tRNA ligase [Candidatus Acidoferrales bacterium]|nr:lysine--tRNA ligase [Candidatus Acidoferrales bacterium]